MQNERVGEIKLGIGLCGNSSSCAPERGEEREEKEEGAHRGLPAYLRLVCLSVRVCTCVPVFIIGHTVPKGAGNDICSDNLPCLLARSNSCHGLQGLTAGQMYTIQFLIRVFHYFSADAICHNWMKAPYCSPLCHWPKPL